jgi:hypothetical protein
VENNTSTVQGLQAGQTRGEKGVDLLLLVAAYTLCLKKTKQTPSCVCDAYSDDDGLLVTGRCASVGDGRGAGGREGRDRLPPLPHHR